MADASELIQQSLSADASNQTSPYSGAGYLAAAAEDAGVSPENISLEAQLAQMSPLELAANFGDNASTYLNDLGSFDYYRDRDKNRSYLSASTDMLRGFASGAIGGVIDTAALGTGLLNSNAGKSLSESSKQFKDWMSSFDSEEAQSRRRALQARKEAVDIELDAEYKRAVASGENSTIAALRREGKGLLKGLTQDFTDSVGFSDVVAQGAGSLITSGGITALAKKGAIKAGKLIAKTGAPHQGAVLAQAGQKYGWAVGAGAVEGGGTYTKTFNDVLDTSIKDLYQKSPEFTALVQQYMAEGLTQKAAEEQARIDIGSKAAVTAGLIQSAAAAGLAQFSKGMEAIVTKPLKARPIAVAKAGVLGEGVEEAGTGATGQLAQNISNKAYIDKDQELTEGIGRATGESFIGGIAAAGSVATPGIARHSYTGTRDRIKKAFEDTETSATAAKPIISPKTESLGKGLSQDLGGVKLNRASDVKPATTNNLNQADTSQSKETSSLSETLAQIDHPTETNGQKKLESFKDLPEEKKQELINKQLHDIKLFSNEPVKDLHPDLDGKSALEAVFKLPNLVLSAKDPEEKRKLFDAMMTFDETFSEVLDKRIVDLTEEGSIARKLKKSLDTLEEEVATNIKQYTAGISTLKMRRSPEEPIDLSDKATSRIFIAKYVSGNLKEDDLREAISSKDFDQQISKLKPRDQNILKAIKTIQDLEGVSDKFKGFKKEDGSKSADDVHKDLTTGHDEYFKSRHDLAKDYITSLILGSKEEQMSNIHDIGSFMKSQERKIKAFDKSFQTGRAVKYQSADSSVGEKQAVVHKHNKNSMDLYATVYEDYLLTKALYDNLLDTTRDNFTEAELKELDSLYNSNTFQPSGLKNYAKEIEGMTNALGSNKRRVRTTVENTDTKEVKPSSIKNQGNTKNTSAGNTPVPTKQDKKKQPLQSAEVPEQYYTAKGKLKQQGYIVTFNTPNLNQSQELNLIIKILGNKSFSEYKKLYNFGKGDYWKNNLITGFKKGYVTIPEGANTSAITITSTQPVDFSTQTQEKAAPAETKTSNIANQQQQQLSLDFDEQTAEDSVVSQDVAEDILVEAEASGEVTEDVVRPSKGQVLVQQEDGTVTAEKITEENSPTFKVLREAGVKEQFLKTVKPRGISSLVQRSKLFKRNSLENLIGTFKGTTKQDEVLRKELSDPVLKKTLNDILSKRGEFYSYIDNYMELKLQDLNGKNGAQSFDNQKENLDNEDFKAASFNRIFLLTGKDNKIPEQVKEAMFLSLVNTLLEKNGVAWNQNLYDDPVNNTWTYVVGGKDTGKVIRGRGYLANEFYSDIGKNTIKFLDLAFTEDTTIPNRQGLETAIGMAAMSAYINMDMNTHPDYKNRRAIFYYKISPEVLIKNSWQGAKFFEASQLDKKSVPYVSIDLGESGEILKKHRSIISQLILSDFDAPVYMNQKPPKVTSAKKIPIGLGKKLTEDGLKAVNNLQDIPYRFDKTIVDFWDNLGKDGLCTLLGCYINAKDREFMNVNHVMTLEGQAETFLQGYEEAHRMIQFATNSGTDPYQADFYFRNSMLKQGRIMQEGTATYVSNKMLRSMISPTWSTLQLNNAEHMQVYGLAMAQIFGIRVQDLGEAESLNRLREVMRKPEFIKLVKDIQTWQADKNISLDPNTIKYVMDTCKIDMSPMAIQYIVDYARMQTAIARGDTTYDTSINFEPDGINNGPANLQAILCTTEFTDTNMIGMAQTGNTFGSGPQSKHDVIESADRLGIPDLKNDMYTQGRNYLQKALEDDLNLEDSVTKSTLNLLRWFGSGWSFKGGKWEISRAAVKPFMRTHVYGSGGESKLGNILHQLADGCNEFMSHVAFHQHCNALSLEKAFEFSAKELGIEGITPKEFTNTLKTFGLFTENTRNRKDFAQNFDLMLIEKEFKKYNMLPAHRKNKNDPNEVARPRLGTVFQSVANKVYGERLMQNFRQYNNAMNFGSYIFMSAFRWALGREAEIRAKLELGDNASKEAIKAGRKKIIENWEFSEKNYDNAIELIEDTIPLIDCGTYQYLALKESFHPEYGETFVDQKTEFNTMKRGDAYPVLQGMNNQEQLISIGSQILQLICPGISTAPNSVIGNGDGKMMAYAFGKAIMKKAANTYDGGQCDIVGAREKTKEFNRCGYEALMDPKSNVYRSAENYLKNIDSKNFSEAVTQFSRDYYREYTFKIKKDLEKPLFPSNAKKNVTLLERISELRQAYKKEHHREYNPETEDVKILQADAKDKVVWEIKSTIKKFNDRYKLPVYAGSVLPKIDYSPVLKGLDPIFPENRDVVEALRHIKDDLQEQNHRLADNMDARQYAIEQVGMSFGNMCGFNSDSSFYSKEGVEQSPLDMYRAQNSLNYLATKFLVEQRGWKLADFDAVWTSDPRKDYQKDDLLPEIAKNYKPVFIENNIFDESKAFIEPNVGGLPKACQQKLADMTPNDSSTRIDITGVFNLLTNEGLFKEMRYFINKMKGADFIKNVKAYNFTNQEEFTKLKNELDIPNASFKPDTDIAITFFDSNKTPIIIMNGGLLEKNKNQYYRNLMHELGHASMTQAIWRAAASTDKQTKDAYKALENDANEFIDWCTNEDTQVELDNALKEFDKATAKSFKKIIQNLADLRTSFFSEEFVDEFVQTALTHPVFTKLLDDKDSSLNKKRVKSLAGWFSRLINNLWKAVFGSDCPADFTRAGTMFNHTFYNTGKLVSRDNTLNKSNKISSDDLTRHSPESDRRVDKITQDYKKVAEFFNTQVKGDPITRGGKFALAKGEAELAYIHAANAFKIAPEARNAFEATYMLIANNTRNQGTSLPMATELYRHILKNVKPATMFKGNPDISREKYRVLFNTSKSSKDSIAQFTAIAMTCPEVIDTLNKLPAPPKEETFGDTWFDQKVEQLGQSALTTMQKLVTKDAGKLNVGDQYLYHAMRVMYNKELTEGTWYNKPHLLLEKGDDYIAGMVNKIGSKVANVASKSNSKLIRDTLNNPNSTAIGIRQYINAANATKTAIGFRQFFGAQNDSWHLEDIIKKLATRASRTRTICRTMIPAFLEKNFKRTFSKDEKAMLTRTVVKTDLACLTRGGYTAMALKRMMSDSKFLKEHQDMHADNFNVWQIKKAKQLAKYLIDGKVTPNLLRNASAIACEVGTSRYNHQVPDSVVNRMDSLITLYALEHLSKEDKQAFAKFLSDTSDTAKEARASLYGALFNNKEDEAKKAKDSYMGKFNRWKGYAPASVRGTRKVQVLPMKDRAKYEAVGYTFKKAVKDSFHPSREYGYFFAPMDPSGAFIQGSISITHQTAGGVNLSTGKSVENTAFFTRREADLLKYINGTVDTSNMIPVYNKFGKIVAIEQRMDQDMIDLLDREDDIFKLVGDHRGRITEEESSKEDVYELIHAMYDQYKDGNKSEYVNLFNAKDLPVSIQKAWDLVPYDVKYQAQKLFGKNTFMVRKDQLEDILGHRQASVTDMWLGNSNWTPANQARFKSVMEAILGKKAAKYLLYGEKGVMTAASWARNAIVVKSLVVPGINIACNVFQLMGRGVPLTYIASRVPALIAQTANYTKYEQSIIRNKILMNNERSYNHRLKYQAVIDNLKAMQAKMGTIHTLVKAGEFNTIADVGTTPENVDLLSGRMEDYITKVVDKLPESVKIAGENILLTKNTSLYKGLEKTVQYGDFIAKSILYEYETNRGMDPEDAKHLVREEFVNYDYSMGRSREYFENIGLMWFYNYKIRIMKSALRALKDKPLFGVIGLMTGGPTMLGTLELPIEACLFAKAMSGGIWRSIGPEMGMDAWEKIPLANLLT